MEAIYGTLALFTAAGVGQDRNWTAFYPARAMILAWGQTTGIDISQNITNLGFDTRR